MKKAVTLFACAFVLAILTVAVFADTPVHTYRNGTVWVVGCIRIKPGHDIEYKTHLATEWRSVEEEEKKQGIILSYRVFVTDDTYGANEWNVLLMKEYKDVATLEASREKQEEIELKLLGGEEQYRKGYDKRELGREIVSQKLVRELVFESSK